jgi:hypothetical protein
MGLNVPPRPMSMTLWPAKRTREDILRDVEQILSARPWMPIYEEGGIDALIEAGEIKPPDPARRALPERQPSVVWI